jgi:mRNA-degrading endonuclease RelE of RelBE toxin-antitoxin system
MAYFVLRTGVFDKKFSKLTPEIQSSIEKLRDKLKENPFLGKPLRYDFFREKKIGKYRVYYLIYKQYLVLYLITVSEKKDQQLAINTVIRFLDVYRKDVEEWARKRGS